MKNNLIYYIMTYVMYLYPPFIYGMVMINFGRLSNVRYWVTGIIVDIVFVLITTVVLFVLAIKKKIPKIDKDEQNHFIFGYIGNMVVFLYTYQYLMGIEKYVSVFSLVLLLVLAYKYLISKTIVFKEIFVTSIVFGVIDYIIIIFSGNTLFREISHFSHTESIIFQILFIGALLYAIYIYVWKLYNNHRWTILRFVLIAFIAIALIMQYIDHNQEEFIMTFIILALFTLLIDVILKLVRKEFKVMDLVFYARLIMLTVIIMLIREMELYRIPDFTLEQMFLLIAIFYVSCFSDIGTNITPRKEHDLDLNLTVEEYIKRLYKPVISRYKDVLVFSLNEEVHHDLSKLGRKMIVKNSLDDLETTDDSGISMVVVYSDDMGLIESILSHFVHLKICVISKRQLENNLLKTSFTDFAYHVYTI